LVLSYDAHRTPLHPYVQLTNGTCKEAIELNSKSLRRHWIYNWISATWK